ncbi:MAG: molybdopterin molybdenumtransferase MoeA, partial [Halothiobacillus sp.]|nr:molybdopterin molybdenumtransferase MoeA [Halothiobacillus sp.]
MQPIDIAQHQLIEQLAPITESEQIQLETALGRFLAEDVYAQQDVPAGDISLFDGYAVRAPLACGSSRQVAG